MRLLVLLGGQVFSGAEITTLRFASALSDDWDVTVAAHPAVARRAEKFELPTTEWEHESISGDSLLRASHFIDVPPMNTQLDKIIDDTNPDAVLTCMFPVAMLALSTIQKHNIPLFVHHQLMYKDIPDHPIVEPVRRVADYAHTIICASRAVERPLHKSEIYNTRVIRAALPTGYGTSKTNYSEKTRFLAVGTWGPVKGLDTLLEAAERLFARRLDFELHIVGPLDSYSTEYEATIRAMAPPGIIFHGATDSPEQYYKNADVLIVPSCDPDPYPTVTLEGMAHGLAVIASGCGGLPEQIVDGATGLLVPPKDIIALTDAMRSLILFTNQIKAMGQVGSQRVAAIADINKQAKLFGSLLQSALAIHC